MTNDETTDCQHPYLRAEDLSRSKAWRAGLADGADAVRDSNADAEEVETWFAPGTLEPDEGTINAIGSNEMGKALGLTPRQVRAHGKAWSAALADYNRGYRTGARRAARARGGVQAWRIVVNGKTGGTYPMGAAGYVDLDGYTSEAAARGMAHEIEDHDPAASVSVEREPLP